MDFTDGLEGKIIPSRDKKPKFALMQLEGLPSKYGSRRFGKPQVGILPFVRLWLEPTDILMELSCHADAEFTLDLLFNAVHQLDDHIEAKWDGDTTGIALSDEDQIAIRNYLDMACADAYGFDVMGLLEQSRLSAENIYGKPGEPKIECPRCTMSFTPKPKAEVDGEYEAIIIECPTCHMKYIAAVSDAALREEIRKYNELFAKDAKNPVGRASVLRMKKLREMEKANKARMKELCAVYKELKKRKEGYENAQKKAD